MKDILVMDKATGELIPATQAIKIFYKSHGILESWLDAYEETKLEAETELAAPNFSNVF